MHAIEHLRFGSLILLLLVGAAPATAAMTLTAGGRVLDAADGTVADGGSWTVFA
jgi:hypothetical protein